MNKAERSLLLYIETCAVDHSGKLDMRHLNMADLEILTKWVADGYIQFGRVGSSGDAFKEGGRSHWVILGNSAWTEAGAERHARAERTWADRKWKTTAEKRGEA